MNYKLIAAIVATGALVSPAASFAQTFDMTPTGTDPSHTALYSDGQPCVVNVAGAHRYTTKIVNVPVSGAYTVADVGTDDGAFALYNGSYNALAPATNCVASFDGGRSVTLSAGQYTLVGGTWQSNDPGPYAISFSGPGVVTLFAPAAVPTLAEWAMILFGVLMAGGAALYIQRRHLAA